MREPALATDIKGSKGMDPVKEVLAMDNIAMEACALMAALQER